METRGEERRKEGNLRESDSLNATGIQVFTFDPCFMFVCRIRDFLGGATGSGIVTLRVPACISLPSVAADNEISFVLD